MKPLGLNVEQEVRADRYPFHLFNIVRQYLLIAAFNFSKAPERLRIVLEPPIFFSWSKWVIHPEPIRSVMNRDSAGLHCSSHFRWVMPLVLFWNFSGVS